jgi:hypothetical protein
MERLASNSSTTKLAPDLINSAATCHGRVYRFVGLRRCRNGGERKNSGLLVRRGLGRGPPAKPTAALRSHPLAVPAAPLHEAIRRKSL